MRKGGDGGWGKPPFDCLYKYSSSFANESLINDATDLWGMEEFVVKSIAEYDEDVIRGSSLWNKSDVINDHSLDLFCQY